VSQKRLNFIRQQQRQISNCNYVVRVVLHMGASNPPNDPGPTFLQPEGPKCEAEGRERRWVLEGDSRQRALTHQLHRSGERCKLPSGNALWSMRQEAN